jgi:hypothetical protein
LAGHDAFLPNGIAHQLDAKQQNLICIKFLIVRGTCKTSQPSGILMAWEQKMRRGMTISGKM